MSTTNFRRETTRAAALAFGQGFAAARLGFSTEEITSEIDAAIEIINLTGGGHTFELDLDKVERVIADLGQ